MPLTIKDFKKTKDKKHVDIRIATSAESSIYSLKQDQGNYSAGNKFLIKENQLDWIMNEYVASKLYQWALGENLISSTLLVVNPNGSKHPYLATKLADNYLTHFVPFGKNHNAGTIDLKCLTNGACKEILPVEGFEKAFVASRLFSEGDDMDLNNYAAITLDNKVVVTRYDFDDSFKFFHLNGITKGMLAESLSPEVKKILTHKGVGTEYFLQAVNSGVQNKPFGWDDFFTSFGPSVSFDLIIHLSKNPQKLEQIFDDLLSLDLQQMPIIVNEAFAEVNSIVPESALIKYYDITKLNSTKTSITEKLADYVIDVISHNFVELQSMKDCLNNFINGVSTIAEDLIMGGGCSQYFISPSAEL